MDVESIYWDGILKQGASITTGSMIFLIIVALMYKKHWNRALLIAFWYYLATFLLNVLEKLILWSCKQNLDVCVPILDYWGITNTHWLSIFYLIKNYVFLGWFYMLIFPDKKIGKIIKWASIFIATASVINYCFIEGYQGIGVFNPAADMFFIVSLPLLYLWYSQRESLRIPLKKNPYFWINMGILIPSLLGPFYYISGDHIYENDLKLFVILNTIKNGFEILGYVLVGIGFSKARYVRFVSTENLSETVV